MKIAIFDVFFKNVNGLFFQINSQFCSKQLKNFKYIIENEKKTVKNTINSSSKFRPENVSYNNFFFNFDNIFENFELF